MKVLTWNSFVRLVLSYAIFIPNEDGSWTVEVPSLPGCVTWGETRAEAAVMAEDAVQGWLLIALRFGDEIPSVDGYRPCSPKLDVVRQIPAPAALASPA